MKKKNKLNKIFSIITFVLSAILIILLGKLNVIPDKYFIPIVIVLLIINLINVLFSFKMKLKKKGKITLLVLSVIISLISLVGSIYLFRTIVFMGGNFSFKGYSTENYSVLVLNTSDYNKIEDLEDKNIGFLKNRLDDENKVKERIDSKVDSNLVELSDAHSLKEKLYNQEIEAMVIEDSYISILKEEDEEFESKTRVIYTFSLKYKVEDISKDVNVTKDVFTIYIAGIDTYGTISSVSRSDVNMLATVNPKTHQVLLTSIPRDYYVQLHGTTGYKDKLTHAGIYGVDMSVKTLEDLLGIEINYYVRVNFTSVVKLVDALKGIDVYSEYTFNSNAGFEESDGYHFVKGYNHLNGDQALAFARTRHAFMAGDRVRGQNQQAVIEALIRKACTPAIITSYTSILDSLEGSFETNLSMDDITKLAKHQIDKMPSWSVTSNSLDGSDASEYTYSYSGQKLYVMKPNEDSITKAKDLLSKIYAGELLESSYDGNATDVKDPSRVDGVPQQPAIPEQPEENNSNTGNNIEEPKNNEDVENNTTDNTGSDKADDELKDHIDDILNNSSTNNE